MSRCVIWHRRGCSPCAATIRDLVPKLEEAGVEVELMDVHARPTQARAEGIDYLPTVVFEDGPWRVVCCGYPPPEAVEAMCG